MCSSDLVISFNCTNDFPAIGMEDDEKVSSQYICHQEVILYPLNRSSIRMAENQKFRPWEQSEIDEWNLYWNNYIDMNSTVTSDNFTVINWFKCSTDVSSFRMLVSKETPAGTPWNYRIYIAQGSGQIVGDIADNSGGVNVISDNSYNDDTWHMVAFSRNSTSKTLSLYIDGYLIKQATDTLTGSITNSQEIWFGRSSYTGQSPTGSYPYKGSLGEAMIYNRALISDEILLN